MNDILYKDECYRIIGACIKVHNELGPGFIESVYHEALEIVLTNDELPYLSEKELPINFMGQKLNKIFYADIVCYDKIILELKAVKELNEVYEAQLFNYLKASGLRLGLLINFGEEKLKYKRIIK